MNKGILIIGNPGEGKNYCEGVEKDLKSYSNYFQSVRGGAWENDEIRILFQPSIKEMNREVEKLDSMEYSMVVFSGHGYSNLKNETVLELSTRGDEYKDSQLIKNNRTVIIDCCRKLWVPESAGRRIFALDMSESTAINIREIARMKYEDSIRNSNGMPVVMYSCSLNEYAQDDSELGGDYSYQLLRAAQTWRKDSDYYDVLDVVQAHDRAKTQLEYMRSSQHPRIKKSREGSYYPFAIDL